MAHLSSFHPFGLTDFLYQRDREIIAFARPDLAVSGTGSLFVAQAVDRGAPSSGQNAAEKYRTEIPFRADQIS
jgi:hypothetical protein